METPSLTALPVALLLLALAGAPAAAADPREQAVVNAVKLANSLEAEYWADPSAYPTWKALYAHYRKGYSPVIAERMTDYTLEHQGEPATWLPDRVQVAGFDQDSAVAWFRTPAPFADDGSWGFGPYMVVRLRREEDGRWVIYWATDSDTPPPSP